MTLTSNEQIAPEIAQALIAQATARGLTVNGYLRQVLGLPGAGTARCWEWMTSRQSRCLPKETAAPRNEAMFAVLQATAARLKTMPVSGSTEASLKLVQKFGVATATNPA